MTFISIVRRILRFIVLSHSPVAIMRPASILITSLTACNAKWDFSTRFTRFVPIVVPCWFTLGATELAITVLPTTHDWTLPLDRTYTNLIFFLFVKSYSTFIPLFVIIRVLPLRILTWSGSRRAKLLTTLLKLLPWFIRIQNWMIACVRVWVLLFEALGSVINLMHVVLQIVHADLSFNAALCLIGHFIFIW